MAVTQTALTTQQEGSSSTTLTTSSISPSANTLIIVAFSLYATSPAATPTVSGNGLTWVQVDNVVDGALRNVVFRAMGASPSSGAVTVSYSGTTGFAGAICHISQFNGVDTSGTNGSGAVRQFAHNTGTGGVSSLTVTLAAFGSSANATFGTFDTNIGDSWTPGSGFTEIYDNAGGFPFTSSATEWRNDNSTSVSMTKSSGSGDIVGIALEIVAAATVSHSGDFFMAA